MAVYHEQAINMATLASQKASLAVRFLARRSSYRPPDSFPDLNALAASAGLITLRYLLVTAYPCGGCYKSGWRGDWCL